MKTIYLSGDHAGFKLKTKIRLWLEKKGYGIIDMGPLEYNKDDDYPDFVIPMTKALAKNRDKSSRGIIIAGSGMGETMASNKIKGIRTALYHGRNLKIVRTSREHDDSNILSFGSRFVTEKEAKRAIDIFLKTKFQSGRHRRRLKKFEKLGSR